MIEYRGHRRCHLCPPSNGKWVRTVLASILMFQFITTGCAVAPPPVSGVGGLAVGMGGAAAVPAPPMTLPRFLGVDTVATGFRRVVYRGRLRASTMLPFLAPLPASAAPVAIGDPCCLESPAPAVATAAAMQQAEAAAPAKVKALAYLATLDSCRNPQVEEAFLAAMEDPSDSVRIAAVQGIIDINHRCGGCANGCGGCCTVAIQSKLVKLAYGTDDRGCWCESNPKVRRLARIGACKCNAAFDQPSQPMPEEMPLPLVMELSKTPVPQ